VQPTNIFDLAFFVKVVDVFDIERQEEPSELSAILSLLLLSGGTQASSATQGGSGTTGISLGDPLTAFLLVQALFPNFRQSDFLPFLVAILGTQGYGTQGTQGNPLLLILPLLLLGSQGGHRHSEFWKKIRREDLMEMMEKVQEQKGGGTSESFKNLLEATTAFLQAKAED
jgi:hypothetical protein